ncbi:hypothetical protein [Pseudorhodoferax sp. Leaf267]|uniref:hypothetical protein n=1 Tax=Pseudorhodoferax sp. Leaf267 TaxID=1736316 RepID=UPI0006F582E9|nr:hypothetical protein [Pseudorhodoferax sp. Leaf267]KQP15160.1 hypothetical protein ASF43_14140 [Pseudorhodoferax sp. Leaf267]
MTMLQTSAPAPVRLVFELDRADNPRLYDELMLFQKGAKRVNRLRVLAYDGLLAQYGALGLATVFPATVTAARSAASGAVEMTNAVFDPGLQE